MNTVIQAFGLVFQPDVMIAIFASAVYGLTVGSLPGLSATMATALLVPVTFYLSPIAAVATIITASAMAIFSGDIPGCLLRIPGTPASAAYTDEAYAMTRKGQAETALGISEMDLRKMLRLTQAQEKRLAAEVGGRMPAMAAE